MASITQALSPGVTIKRDDYRGTHVYTIEGDERVAGLTLPSITTVLNMVAKPALVAWAERQAIAATIRASTRLPGESGVDVGTIEERARSVLKSESEDRMNMGTIMHDALLAYASGSVTLEDMTDDYRPTAERFEAWLVEHGAQVLHTERVVYSVEEGLGGTLDIAGVMGDGTSFVGELKSASSVYPEHVAQVAGYEQAAEGCLPGFTSPARCFVFLAGPDGRFEAHELSPVEVLNGLRLLGVAADMYEAHRDLRAAIRERDKEQGGE